MIRWRLPLARTAGVVLLAGAALLAAAAAVVAPNDPARSFPDRSFAPPTRVHVYDHDGWHAPFIYSQRLTDRLLRVYEEDQSARVPVRFLSEGRLFSVPDTAGPLLVLGADAIGRDLFSRLLFGARLSLTVALAGVIGALLIGAGLGAVAGTMGGRVDRCLMLLADFVIVLPGTYLVLMLRGALPPVLAPADVFWLLAIIFAISAWPHVARGVRAIVASERARDYAEAARAAGAGPWRLAWQLLPATRGFLAVEIVLLAPAMLVAEATIAFLGLGVPEPHASWGRLLQDGSDANALLQAPWLLAPAVALFVLVLALQLAAGPARTAAFAWRR